MASWRSVAFGSLLVAGALLASTARAQHDPPAVTSSAATDDDADAGAATVTDAGPPGCNAGFVAVDETHCCRPGERLVAGACVGVPVTCAPGEVRTGDHCAPRPCDEGWLALEGGHCCWPGQSWDDDAHACTGRPRCPEGTWAVGRVGCGSPARSAPPSHRPSDGRAHLGLTTFRMGSGERYVTLGAFAIDRTEVTVAAYAACVRAGACVPVEPATAVHPGGDHPVTGVSFDMAARFCAFAGARLPTEAEWELAARGTDGRRYPWGDRVPDCTLAQMTGCGTTTARVGGHPGGVSPFGVFDLAGNVAEWTADRVVNTLPPGSVRDPVGGATGDLRVVRGGSFASDDVRATARVARHAGEARFDVGFRCARGE